jgi:antitoxin component of MazEF toxin-antitoxin module
MQINQLDMDSVVAGLTTKSDKIRALGRAGYTRSQIAKFLDIKYQFAWNVLDDDARLGARRASAAGEMAEASRPFDTAPRDNAHSARKIVLGKDGVVQLPRAVLDAAGLHDGDALLVRFDEDGIQLYTPAAATRRVRALVREHIPEGVNLADELVAERRREAERERRGE